MLPKGNDGRAYRLARRKLWVRRASYAAASIAAIALLSELSGVGVGGRRRRRLGGRGPGEAEDGEGERQGGEDANLARRRGRGKKGGKRRSPPGDLTSLNDTATMELILSASVHLVDVTVPRGSNDWSDPDPRDPDGGGVSRQGSDRGVLRPRLEPAQVRPFVGSDVPRSSGGEPGVHGGRILPVPAQGSGEYGEDSGRRGRGRGRGGGGGCGGGRGGTRGGRRRTLPSRDRSPPPVSFSTSPGAALPSPPTPWRPSTRPLPGFTARAPPPSQP